MSNYTPTIGLEIHAELKTKTKLFCSSKNDPDESRPNWNICPVCMGHPGTLPVLNKEAVRHVLRVGTAVGGDLADYTEFDRKNYFYPDIPKGYQISQYAYPLVSGGKLSDVAITRVHLEEDTARSIHPVSGSISQKIKSKSSNQFSANGASNTADYSLIDFNRAGVPLMELVTEPVIHTAQEASRFAKELQLLIRCLGAGDANMEKGELRVEANISISNNDELGTKVEVKNLNSFRAVEKAIQYEISRHTVLLKKGESAVQETRGWDETKQKTFSQRLKEESHDYRYFPDPDIPKLKLSDIPEFSHKALSSEMPELPWDRRERYVNEFGIKEEDASMYVRNPIFGNFFELVVKELDKNSEAVSLASNYISSDLAGMYQESKNLDDITLSPKNFAALVNMIVSGDLSSRGAKDILVHLVKKDSDPRVLAEELGLLQKSNEAELLSIVGTIIKENKKAVEEYRNGKDSSLQFLIGQGMKATKGAANPTVLKKIIEEKLKS